MSIIDIIIMNMRWWYYPIIIGFSLFYAIQKMIEKRNIYPKGIEHKWENCTKYFHQFLSQVIFTVSGFMALFIANYVFSKITSFNDISVGTTILLIFLIIWGITGVSGYLGYLIVSGKFMGLKTKEE